MRDFAAMFDAIDRTTSTSGKVSAMAAYFRAAAPGDAAWAVYFLTGRRMKRLLTSRQLWGWLRAATGLDEWLLGACYDAVGDSAETIALLLESHRPAPEPVAAADSLAAHGADGEAVPAADVPLHEWIEGRLRRLPTLEPAEQRRTVLGWWSELEGTPLFLLNKLMTGELRVGVSQRLVVRALAEATALPPEVVEHRLAGEWSPSAAWYARLVGPSDQADELAPRPYPFFLASPIVCDDRAERDAASAAPAEFLRRTLGDRGGWLAEWKWDGIRAQLIRRGGRLWLWSRGDELITDRFPEVAASGARLPDGVVLDGEILAYRDGPLRFALLQKRIGRTAITPRILREAPAAMIVYDVLELDGADVRARPLQDRRAILDGLLARLPEGGRLVPSPTIDAPTWEALAEARLASRARRVEGVMLKRLDSPYRAGRVRGDWWKWKIEPLAIDAVLVYAQPGHGRRASLLTDYTFAVWDDGGDGASLFAPEAQRRLVPVAKAYSGLTNGEIEELDRWIRQHTTERFGPVRAVEPRRVFELHFEGLAESDRHRSGLALRFPRIARERPDKSPADADTLARVKEILRAVS